MDNKQGQRLDVPESKIDIINMARIFIMGSSDGPGVLAAQMLIYQKHQVVLHARNEKRKEDTVARQWPDVYANGLNPGWVPTKMGGSSASDDLQKGYETQVWLATSNNDRARVSGQYFFLQKPARPHPDVNNLSLQEEFISLCREITGILFPK